jgi:hypothetical protein
MAPTILDGDLIEVEPSSAAALRRNDIAFYKGRHGPIAHRVVRIEGSGASLRLLLRGDAAKDLDEPIGSHAVLGRVVAVKRGARRIGLVGPMAAVRRRVRGLAGRLHRLLILWS